MTSKLKVFTSPSAFPNPQRLRLFMHEKGIADQFEEIIYDMTSAGEQRGWRHLKTNPWGETPTLQLADGSFISETAAVVRYLDQTYPGRKITGDTPLEQGLDTMWDDRIWVHILYRITTAFHVLHTGLGFKLELTNNAAWGEHCRKEALAHAALVDKHLADGADITLATAIAFSKYPVNATPLDERFEFLDAYWQRWQQRPGFQAAYADRQSGIPALDNRD
jgi:glutathione S-transferase